MPTMIKSLFILVVGLASFCLLNSLGSNSLMTTRPNKLYSLRKDPVFGSYLGKLTEAQMDELIEELVSGPK